MISNNFDVFKLLGQIIHRLLHNKNVNLVYSLINSLKSLQQIRKTPLQSYQLPEAYKQWDDQSLELHMKESKIDSLIAFSEKNLPLLLEKNMTEKDLLVLKLSDEITTMQLQIDFVPLIDWAKSIWFKEIALTYKDLYWNKV